MEISKATQCQWHLQPIAMRQPRPCGQQLSFESQEYTLSKLHPNDNLPTAALLRYVTTLAAQLPAVTLGPHRCCLPPCARSVHMLCTRRPVPTLLLSVAKLPAPLPSVALRPHHCCHYDRCRLLPSGQAAATPQWSAAMQPQYVAKSALLHKTPCAHTTAAYCHSQSP